MRFNYENVLEFVILNKDIWLMARCGLVKWFEKLIDLLLWSPCAMVASYVAVRSLRHVLILSEVAVSLLMEKCCVPHY